ncbi:calcium-binding protein [Microseira wollei]|nr:calcium-binding protein [Microseira wollei]
MTNTTAIQNLVNDLVKVNGIFGLYSYASAVDPATVLNNLTSKTSDELLDYLEQACVSSTTISNFENIFSQSNGTSLLTSLLSTYNGGFSYNINQGNSNLTGSTGNDLIVNIDDITGSLTGNAGNDLLLNASSASSTLKGGDGDDVLANLSTASSTLEGGSGNDLLVSISTATSTLNGDAGNDTLINLGYNAQMSGGDGADVLVGWDGNDTLTGGNGADNLSGGAGADKLTGGSGNDTVTGGGGADTFQFSAEYGITSWQKIGFFKFPIKFGWQNRSGIDVIKDFNASQGDIIEIDTNSSSSAATLRSNLSFNASTGQLSFAGNVVATLEGVTSFNTSSVQFMLQTVWECETEPLSIANTDMQSLENALAFIEEAVYKHSGEPLTDLQKLILRAAWEGNQKTYSQIAAEYNYSDKYLQQVVGPKLWQLISNALGQKVT